MKPITIILCAIILSIGMISSSSLLYFAALKFRTTGRYVIVKGLAEMNVKADLAIWKIKFKVSSNDFEKVNHQIIEQKLIVEKFLFANGIKDEDVESFNVRVIDLLAKEYTSEKMPVNRFIGEGKLSISSKNVNQIYLAASKSSSLVREGVILDEPDYEANPKYFFTGLNEIRPTLIASATKSAKSLAEQFAQDSGSSVGPIKKASQGLFTILAFDNQESSNEQAYVNKKVRVVSTIEYFLNE